MPSNHRSKTIFSILFLRTTREEFESLDKIHFFIGLTATWLVGIGRYWDDPKASLLQHMGLGSVIYIFCLSALIWLIVLPLRTDLTYFRILTFISLTSFPAILYAIPVERFMSISAATSINGWFLAIVATWRVLMLFNFLKQFIKRKYAVFTVLFLPICAIVNALSILNLERAVFDLMGGLRGTANDNAYFIVLVLTVISYIMIGPLIILYGNAIAEANKKK